MRHHPGGASLLSPVERVGDMLISIDSDALTIAHYLRPATYAGIAPDIDDTLDQGILFHHRFSGNEDIPSDEGGSI